MMVSQANLFAGSHFNVLRVKLLDNLVEPLGNFTAVQHYNLLHKLPLYLPKPEFISLLQKRPSSGTVSQLSISSSETFALGLVALELGLMTPLADRVCNISKGDFDSEYLEDCFTRFRAKYSNYPQLITIVHELVGAKTSPRTDPDYLLHYQTMQPSDLVCYETTQLSTPRSEMINPSIGSSQLIHHGPSSVVYNNYETPVKYMHNHYTSTSEPMSQSKVVLASHESSPSSEGKKSALMIDPSHPHYDKVASRGLSPRQIDRSKSPIAKEQRSNSPYRPLLGENKSRSVTPTKVNHPPYDANHDSKRERRKYVSKVDISTSQMALIDEGTIH